MKLTKDKKITILQMVALSLGSLLVGSIFLSAIPVQSIWGIDVGNKGAVIDGTFYSKPVGSQFIIDVDGTGIGSDGVTIESLQPTVTVEYSGLRHVDQSGAVTDWTTPAREWEAGERLHFLHFFEFDCYVRTISTTRVGNQVIHYPLPHLELFPYEEIDRVTVRPQFNVHIKPQDGNEEFHCGYGNAYVVAVRGVQLNPALDSDYMGVWDSPEEIQMPALNSRVEVSATEIDEEYEVFLTLETWCSLQAGVAYAYPNPFWVPEAIAGAGNVENVGCFQTIRFSFELTRPVVVEQADVLEPVLDVAPLKLTPDTTYIFIIAGIVILVVVFAFVFLLAKMKQKKPQVQVVLA